MEVGTPIERLAQAAWGLPIERQLAVEVLPALSTANVRELLKAALPLPQLTPDRATKLVLTHLVNRARSTSSRLKSQVKPLDSS